jgi:dipeptidyl aminopeptidase/acylaminoacyl peptidase
MMSSPGDRFRRASCIAALSFLAAAGGWSCTSESSSVLPDATRTRWWAGTGQPQEPTTGRLTVEDMIRFASIGDPETLTWMDFERNTSSFSPNGEHALVLIRRGNPEEETNEGVLLLYRTADLLNAPEPQVLAHFSSATNYQPLAMVRWLDDRTVVFAATNGEDPSQVYRVDIDSRRGSQLTREPEQLKWYDISQAGQRLVVFSALPEGMPRNEDPHYLGRGRRITEASLQEAESGSSPFQKIWGGQIAHYDLRTGTRRTITSPDHAQGGSLQCFFGFNGGLSPDGRYGLQECMMGDWPEWWEEYTVDPGLATNLRAGNDSWARQLFLVDLDADSFRPLTGAPKMPGTWAEAIWIEGGRRVIVPGAVVPLPGRTGAERERLASSWAVLAIEAATGGLEVMAELPPAACRVTAASWDESSSTLTVEMVDEDRKELPTLVLRSSPEGWLTVPGGRPAAAPAADPPVRLFVAQSPNDRPVLWAEDAALGAREVLLDPNPWLGSVQLGRVEEVSWSTGGQRTWHGTLYYPSDYVEGERYPLVVQTHGRRQGQFSLDGYVRIFAAQPMAARGMMVLQVDEAPSIRDVIATPDEWPTVRAGLEGAIDFLDSRYLIDRTRVGTVGWSRTGPHTGYVLTHSSYPIAAAVMMDSSDFGWFAYFAWGGAREFDLNYGAAPFGRGLESWLEIIPSFNLERIRTPVLMWNAGSAISRWDWYAGLRRLGRPVEYWIIPDGEHDLFKVGQRLLVNHLTVDWFDFWLNGHEDKDPAKGGQYARWRVLRDQQERAMSEPRPPLYDWSAKPIPTAAAQRQP